MVLNIPAMRAGWWPEETQESALISGRGRSLLQLASE